jgi:hypothetical protein
VRARGVALIAVAALYLTGVASGLLVLFGGCQRCQQDNAYLGLALLPLFFAVFANILAAMGLILTQSGNPWLLPLPWIGVPLLLVGALEVLRYPIALWLALLVAVAVSLPLLLRLRGTSITGATLAAAGTVTILAQVRGTQEWGTVGFDMPVLVAIVLLALPLGWLTARQLPQR